jgi:hypothetical protein
MTCGVTADNEQRAVHWPSMARIRMRKGSKDTNEYAK